LAKGDLIFYLDSDDYLHDQGLSHLVSALGDDIDAIYGDVSFINSEGTIICIRDQCPVSDDWVLSMLELAPMTSSVLFRKNRIDIYKWNINLPCAQEFAYFVELAIQGIKFSYVPFVVSSIRHHSSFTRITINTNRKLTKVLANLYMHFEDELLKSNQYNEHRKIRINRVFLNIALTLWREGDRLLANTLYKKVDKSLILRSRNFKYFSFVGLAYLMNLKFSCFVWKWRDRLADLAMFFRKIARIIGIGKFFSRYVFYPMQKLSELRFPNHDVMVETGGNKLMVFSPRKNRISRAIFKDGIWEPRVTSLLKVKTHPGMVALDIGADIGYYTLLFASLVGRNGRVIAFEPIPEARKRLEHNILINGYGNVVISKYALGNREGTVFLEDPLNKSRINLSNVRSRNKSIIVSIRRMDDLLTELKLNSIDIVKIDVEGAEHEVLRGMEHTLREYQPLLIIEVHHELLPLFGSSSEKLLDWISNLGYQITQIDQELEINRNSINIIFCCLEFNSV